MRSNQGTRFEISEVEGLGTLLPAGEQAMLVVWTDRAPRWFGTKYLSVHVPGGALGNGVERILSKNMDEVERREVAQF